MCPFSKNIYSWNEKLLPYLPKASILVTLVFFIALIMTYQSGSDPRLLDSTMTIEFVLKQANLLPATFISPIMSYSSQCPESYERVIFKHWGGTSVGCSCAGKNYTSACSSNRFGCVSLKAIPQADITLWKGVGYCVKRARKYAEKFANGSCPTGMKACPTSCVGLEDACPINSFTILNTYNGSDPNQILLNTGETALYSRNGTGRPVANLTVSFFDAPCITPTYHPSPMNGSVHFLEIEQNKGCSALGAYQLASTFDEASISSVFDDNLLTKEVTALPGYLDFTKANSAYFSAISILNIDRTLSLCQNFQDVLPSQLLSSTSDLYATLKGAKWIIFILLALVIIGFLIEGPTYTLYGPEDWKARYATMAVVDLVVLLELLLIAQGRAVSYHQSNTYAPAMSYMVSISSCFKDQQVQNVLATYIASLESYFSGTYLWASISFGVSMFILLVLASSLIIKFGFKHSIEDEESESNLELEIELITKTDTNETAEFIRKRHPRRLPTIIECE